MVKKGDLQLQVQTEYAQRPAPRITTTILNAGQVVNKIERALDHEISSLDEQARVEVSLKRQHQEVIGILQDQSAQQSHNAGIDGVPESEWAGKLMTIPGVQKVYALDNDGNFFSDSGSEEFRKAFGPIFRNIRELMTVFGPISGTDCTRESGVYEVERDRLYFASTGGECYFVIVRRVNVTTNYEQEIKSCLEIGSAG
ncbi:hypothetical protein C3F09_03480 [candidate division GN15 bacterium]|uniref:Uncharacterized protein n=1 Tax=candidate division GN15 bacterium TaxID=2072418 RepID=A0A855X323_9BACT|nr:MAG: hypothetical protein C3F09_03480 [candidate division GN15 bacterium]